MQINLESGKAIYTIDAKAPLRVTVSYDHYSSMRVLAPITLDGWYTLVRGQLDQYQGVPSYYALSFDSIYLWPKPDSENWILTIEDEPRPTVMFTYEEIMQGLDDTR